MDAPPPAAIDQTTVTPSTCFLDPVWLQQVGGARADNVLAYFERSPFYETGEGLEFALGGRGTRAVYLSRSGARRPRATVLTWRRTSMSWTARSTSARRSTRSLRRGCARPAITSQKPSARCAPSAIGWTRRGARSSRRPPLHPRKRQPRGRARSLKGGAG